MATVEDAKQRAADVEEHRKIYSGIMKNSTEVGVPFCMGLAMFFTQLVLGNGVIVALVSYVVVHLVVMWIVKTFFTH